jgi:integrase
VVPCPPSLAKLIRRIPRRIDTNLLFPTPTGKLWRDRYFYRDVWYPAQADSGMDIRPHECRHSYVTHLRAAGIDDADLADIAGHRVETMLARYTHPLRPSIEQVKRVIG